MHIAPGKSFQQGSMHVHDLIPFQTTEFDTSHVIDKLSFGAEYPGAPLLSASNFWTAYFIPVSARHLSPLCYIYNNKKNRCCQCGK